MEFVSQITTSNDCYQIAEELTRGQTGSFDLGVLFVSAHRKDSIPAIIHVLREKIYIKNLIGCTSAGIIGASEEIERRPAATLILGRLPDVKITPFFMNQAQLEGLKSPVDWHNYFEVYPNERPVFIALPDPFMFDAMAFLSGLNQAYPAVPVVGGLASGGMSPGENILITNGGEFNEGVVGLVLTGNIRVDTVVSQGCKPIGQTYIVTGAVENRILSLAGRPFLDVLKGELGKLSPSDQLLAQEAIFVGIAMNEYTEHFKRGDFLIRGLMGLDPENNAGVIADFVKPGQTVQFHLRDAKTAREDLSELLTLQQTKIQSEKPKGALVFCCNGRGEYLFRQKNHDIEVIQKHLGPLPAAGFFCAGEIGPVGKSNFLHGFTNSIALFYPAKN